MKGLSTYFLNRKYEYFPRLSHMYFYLVGCVLDVRLCMNVKFVMSLFDWQAANQSNCTVDQMEFIKMFDIDCRWFLFCPSLSQFSPIYCTPLVHSFTQPVCSLTCVISLPGKGKESATMLNMKRGLSVSILKYVRNN